jgi:hypothetical protein
MQTIVANKQIVYTIHQDKGLLPVRILTMQTLVANKQRCPHQGTSTDKNINYADYSGEQTNCLHHTSGQGTSTGKNINYADLWPTNKLPTPYIRTRDFYR